MQTLLAVLTVSLLCIVIYQDFRYRAVVWIIFPALFISIYSFMAVSQNYQYALQCFVINSLFVFFQFALIYLFYRVKGIKFKNVTRDYIGWGDILFILVVTPAFPIQIFIIYLVSGYFLTLIVFLTLRYLIPKYTSIHQLIPLAGTMAIWFLALKTIEYLFPLIFCYVNL
jgi:hypothetical protein